ncbi:MAG: GAF domain-containing sensor histidine kinase [Anaerolineae bacterium]
MPDKTTLLKQQPSSAPRSSIVEDIFDLTAAASLNEMLGRALRMAIRIVGAEGGSIFFLATSPVSIQAGAFRPEALAQIQRWEKHISRQLKQNAWRIPNTTAQIVSVSNIAGSPQQVVNVPLLASRRVVGTMSFVLAADRTLIPPHYTLLTQLSRGIGQIGATMLELHLARHMLDRIGAFYDVGQALVTTFDINKLLVNTMELATKLTDSGAASILLIDDDQRELVFRVSHGARSELLRQHRIPIGEGIAGWVARTGRPVIANDARADARFSHRVDVRTGFLTQSIAATPLKIKGRVIGVLEVLNKYSDEGFSQDDVQLLSYISTQAAIAIENARSYHRLREERDQLISQQTIFHREVSGSLHDGVMQYLSAISLSLDHLKLLSANSAPDVLEHQIVALQKLVAQATRKTRSLLFDLRPPILETHGLVAACKFYVEQLDNVSTFEIHLRAPEEVQLPPKENVAIFSVVQEAFSNITSHAKAEHAWLKLDVEEQRLVVTISDDGRGFNLASVENNPRAEGASASGLEKMKRLAKAINADLRIESSMQLPHRGTTIQLLTPLPRR